MKYLLLLVIPVWLWVGGFCAKALLEFAADNDSKWWGGLPLWMAGAVPLFAIGVGGLVCIVSVVTA